MEQIFKDFGIQPILLLAQIVNFLVLLLILKRFLYKPILKVLEERKEKIAESLKNAQDIEKKLHETNEQADKIIAKTMEQSKKILNEAEKSSETIIDEGKLRGEDLAERIVQETRVQMQYEKEKLRQEVRSDALSLVMLALQKVTGKTFNKKDQKDLIKKTIEELK